MSELDRDDLPDLAVRLGKLEATQEIRKLKMDYAKLCDAGYPPAEISAMFTDDAVWDGGEKFGVHQGRQAIYDFFEGVSKDLVFAIHFMIGDSIAVDDNLTTASGSWQLLEPLSLVVDGQRQAMWFAGTYADEYVKIDGEWKFNRVTLDWVLQARHDIGWAESRLQV